MGRSAHFGRWAAVLLGLTMVVGFVPSDARAAGKEVLWVFSNEVTMDSARQTLVSRSAASGVDALYLSIYRSTPNSAGRRMYEDSDIAALITLAHDQGIEIWAAYGNPDWPNLGCSASAFPRQRMAEVIAYNQANPTARLDGVALDVEPTEPQSVVDFQELLALYECFGAHLAADNLGLSIAIRFFWDTPVDYPPAGPVKPVYQHVIDLDVENVVVMGYRDRAGGPCPDDAIVCLDYDELAYADAIGKSRLILVGLETSNCAPGCGPEKVTFFEEGQDAFNAEREAVRAQLGTVESFGGFATHRYNDAYLSGAPGWPETNPVAKVAVPNRDMPPRLRLLPITPNPFDQQTAVTFELQEPAAVTLSVFDSGGRLLRTLLHEFRAAGRHVVRLRWADGLGPPLPAGVYYVRLAAGSRTASRRVVSMR